MKEDNKSNESNESKKSKLENYFNKLEKSKEEKEEDLEDFINIKKNLSDHLYDIPNNFLKTNNLDEFLELNEDFKESIIIFDHSYSECFALCLFFAFGLLYSAIQLVGVQEMIIILNTILNELIDEMKLSIIKTPREYNFYEVIKICSYKEIPDIDVAMVTSFIGIIISRSLGFITTNIIFQLTSGVLFLFFFFFSLFILEKN